MTRGTCRLALEDGSVFTGHSFGAQGTRMGAEAMSGIEGGPPQNNMYPGRDGASFQGKNDSPTDTLLWP